VLVIGDYATGKTSLIKRYTEGCFTPNYKLTIGVDFALKSVPQEGSEDVSLQLWDIAGHERFGCMTRVYYKYAIAAVIVYDMSRPATFDAVLTWLEDLNNKVCLANGERVPVVLVGNKCDSYEGPDVSEKMEAFTRQHGLVGWFPTSAKDNTNVDAAFECLLQNILQVADRQVVNTNDADTVVVQTQNQKDAGRNTGQSTSSNSRKGGNVGSKVDKKKKWLRCQI
jgi:Ras-related protein Rab-32